jgi:hypothetical protein
MTSEGLNGRYWEDKNEYKYYIRYEPFVDDSGSPYGSYDTVSYYYYGNNRQKPKPDSGEYIYAGEITYKNSNIKFYKLPRVSIDEFVSYLKNTKQEQFKNISNINGEIGILCSTSNETPDCIVSGGRRRKTRRKKTIRRKFKSRKVTRNRSKNRK